MLADSVEANLRMVRRFDFIGAISRSPKAKLHVGLSAAQPNVAHQNFMQLHRWRPINVDGVGSAGCGGLNRCLPATVRTRHRLRGVSGNFHPHHFPGLRPSPDRIGFPTLENHVIAEHRADERKGGFGRDGSDTCDERPNESANRFAEHDSDCEFRDGICDQMRTSANCGCRRDSVCDRC